MENFILIATVLAATALAYQYGRRRALGLVGGKARELHSLPGYHGAYVALWCLLPAAIFAILWIVIEPIVVRQVIAGSLAQTQPGLTGSALDLALNEIHSLSINAFAYASATPEKQALVARYRELQWIGTVAMASVALVLVAVGLFYGSKAIAPRLRARQAVERVVMWAMVGCATIAILTTIGIISSLLFEAMRFFQFVSPIDFLFGLHWSPQIAMRADQVGSTGAFGAVPVFAGTLLITAISMAVAVPIGLMSAIYMAEYSSKKFRAWVKPLLEILAGVPTVVYGFFAALTVAPFIRDLGHSVGLDVASESALAAGVVMGIMIIPFVSSLSDDVINAVPQSLRDGAYAMGATKSETIRQVVIPAAFPGIVGSIMLAVSRAIGETMIVVMAAGMAANLTANPFAAVTTVTVQIVTLLIGDQEFDSPKTLAAFALGLVLFVVTLCLNIIALTVVRRYREQYE
ncbi:MAG: phosphate transporter permease [Rhodospirillales bacterium]|jgi:phosphate transport system permease protein|nr:phosphate transporter permease [Rhodospirillales bacterium]